MEIKFPIGRLVATPAALEEIGQSDEGLFEYVNRHMSGDWGIVCDEDKEENNQSVIHGNRILSAYKLPTGVKIWIITEADRSSTTILLPDEY